MMISVQKIFIEIYYLTSLWSYVIPKMLQDFFYLTLSGCSFWSSKINNCLLLYIKKIFYENYKKDNWTVVKYRVFVKLLQLWQLKLTYE